eukprot:scaffold74445_cov40-Prasinocladus_malaysianus.AAC.2
MKSTLGFGSAIYLLLGASLGELMSNIRRPSRRAVSALCDEHARRRTSIIARETIKYISQSSADISDYYVRPMRARRSDRGCEPGRTKQETDSR